jgi:glycosyltransferase involved in cell wall biosynthesis
MTASTTPTPAANLSIVIPTYRREKVLVDTLKGLLELEPKGVEIVVVDQTPEHQPEVQAWLDQAHGSGRIRHIRKALPSIPEAMNLGALEATGELILYLDDDIIPDDLLLHAHIVAHEANRADLVAGRVLQPWHSDCHTTDAFTKTVGESKAEFIGCNFSIRRELLIELGGFDENFKGAAYNYEREFADRLMESGSDIWYEPSALIRHLHYSDGGTRSKGDHLTSLNSRHPVGAYYYFFRSPRVKHRLGKTLKRFFGALLTRHHLRKPWYIPITFLSELGGILWALRLRLSAPALPLRSVSPMHDAFHVP